MSAEQPPASIRVPLPGSGFMVTYESQGERERTLRLAEARQQIAHEGNRNPTWQELTDDERGTSELSARNWLRAAKRAGLLAEQDQDDDTHGCNSADPGERAGWAAEDEQAGVGAENETAVHWPARGLRITTWCQGEPLAGEAFADREPDVTCPDCLALLAGTNGGAR